MFTRVVQFTGASDLDAGVAFVREHAAPLLHQQKGFRGMTASVDRTAGVFGVLSLWETEADRDASESVMAKVRDEAQKIIGGHMTIEHYEEVLMEADSIPTPGAALFLQRVSMDPARVDENLAYFRQEILPQIKSGDGFIAVRQMIDRTTGDAIVGSLWRDAAARDAAYEAALARRGQAGDRVTFGETSKREIVYVDLP